MHLSLRGMQSPCVLGHSCRRRTQTRGSQHVQIVPAEPETIPRTSVGSKKFFWEGVVSADGAEQARDFRRKSGFWPRTVRRAAAKENTSMVPSRKGTMPVF